MTLKKERTMYIILLAVGIFVLVGGIILAKVTRTESLIAGITGLSSAWITISSIKLYRIKRHPQKYEKEIIGQNDERNIAIRGYAGYATFLTTLMVVGIMTMVFLILDFIVATIIAVGVLLIHTGSFLFFARYYSKKI